MRMQTIGQADPLNGGELIAEGRPWFYGKPLRQTEVLGAHPKGGAQVVSEFILRLTKNPRQQVVFAHIAHRNEIVRDVVVVFIGYFGPVVPVVVE